MEIIITQQQHNPLLKRTEVAFTIDHKQTRGTPTRLEIRNTLAEMLKTKPEVIYIKRIETKAGTMTATGEANAYDSVEHAQRIEAKYVIERHQPKEKKETAEATQAPAPPAEKAPQPAEKAAPPAKKEG